MPRTQNPLHHLRLIGISANNLSRFSELYRRKLQQNGQLDSEELLAFFSLLQTELGRIREQDGKAQQCLKQPLAAEVVRNNLVDAYA